MTCAHHTRRGRLGFTLIEMVVVIVLIGLVLTMVGPRFTGVIRNLTARSATSQVLADLALTRTQAVRDGRTASLRVLTDSTYRVTIDDNLGAQVRVVKNVTLPGTRRGVALGPVGSRIAFDSRGMRRTGAGTASTLLIQSAGKADTVNVTIVGRVSRGSQY